jgi:hypothetical protein
MSTIIIGVIMYHHHRPTDFVINIDVKFSQTEENDN